MAFPDIGRGIVLMFACHVLSSLPELRPGFPGKMAKALHPRQAWWLLGTVATACDLLSIYIFPSIFKFSRYALIATAYWTGTPVSESCSCTSTQPVVVVAFNNITTWLMTVISTGMRIFVIVPDTSCALTCGRYAQFVPLTTSQDTS